MTPQIHSSFDMFETIKEARQALETIIAESPILVWTRLPEVIKMLEAVEAKDIKLEKAA